MLAFTLISVLRLGYSASWSKAYVGYIENYLLDPQDFAGYYTLDQIRMSAEYWADDEWIHYLVEAK